MKQWHTITFSAKLDQDDIKAMNKCFYDAMNESMEILECANLIIRAEYEESRKEKAAADFIEAIKTLASKPENLENLQFYLEQHFPVWMKKFAYDPDCLAAEMKEFANMEI